METGTYNCVYTTKYKNWWSLIVLLKSTFLILELNEFLKI